MRIWTLHPRYLDAKGLVALWREALLAQHVLAGTTKGYRFHPQLIRFRKQPDPLITIAAYLHAVAAEATQRGYRFDTTKIQPITTTTTHQQLDETEGQLRYEWSHLLAKLALRQPALAKQWQTVVLPEAHPLFRIVPGEVNLT